MSFGFSPAVRLTAVVWAVAVGIMLVADRQYGFIALGFAFYMGLMYAAVRWLVPSIAVRDDDVLRARGDRRSIALRLAIVVAALAVWFGMGFTFDFRIPLLSPLMVALWKAPLPLHGGALAPFTFAAYALAPCLLLLALGATTRTLGLTRPVRGTLRAAIPCLALPLVFWTWAFTQGKATPIGLVRELIYDTLNAGFPEEFSNRGMLFSHIRAFLTTDWAIVTQAFVFALMHVGITIREEHYNPILIAANVIALNVPMGIVMALIALRTRSIALPAVIHVSLDSLKHIMG
jgi:membrane protease YdiL (CAAX protease family)